ncbi:MAG: hypothetical protein H0V45_13245 [Actinobacteria bacterium]|nr:hypothetical protein [Actinomycetota bacterium]
MEQWWEPWNRVEPSRQGLRELVAVRAALAQLEAGLVSQARSEGNTWAQIAFDLGISAQSAHRKHRGHDPLRR